ncbi:MAG: enoyl-CoA hydratase/isomerase family protein [Proteobacteria bacterium]|jgi:enoyl-CoA hydratase|nr:enoyl-CoA hydratase/isomerase family protein [Pseudomonadota bacterium]MDP4829081.1 enoyl-CoA hydratase/isomerase family protein [Burkholderiaceae bacterium]
MNDRQPTPPAASRARQSRSASKASAGRVWCSRAAGGHVATVWLSHPGRLNALSAGMWKALADVFNEIAADELLRAVVVRGEGGAFASGADITEFAELHSSRDQVRRYHDEILGEGLRAVMNCPVPVIAAIDGPCVGGGLEIATACDLRIASRRSSFGVPIGRIGFPIAPLEAACVLELVGRANALELLLEGRIWPAEEAYTKGLVNRLVDDDDWERELEATLQRVCSCAPHASRRSKWILRQLSGIDDRQKLSQGQRESCWDFAETSDYAKGLDAFLTKTRPQFKND